MSQQEHCTEENRLCKGRGDCPAINDDGFACTREEGHEGPHVACGGVDHNHACWTDETPKAEAN